MAMPLLWVGLDKLFLFPTYSHTLKIILSILFNLTIILFILATCFSQLLYPT